MFQPFHVKCTALFIAVYWHMKLQNIVLDCMKLKLHGIGIIDDF
jgi:hypothetical protein